MIRIAGRTGILVACSLLGQSAGAQTTEWISEGTGEGIYYGSEEPSISPDGRFVAFVSDASVFVSPDTNDSPDAFVRDRKLGTVERVTVSNSGGETGGGGNPSISANGRIVAFGSGAANVVPNDTNRAWDIFVRDRIAGTTERVSVSSNEAQANKESVRPSVSADGRFVAFSSPASNLVANDSNNSTDIFVRDLIAGTTERVSGENGAAPPTSYAISSISADGRYVAFGSYGQVYVADRQNDTLEIVSIADNEMAADAESFYPSISADGRFVAFCSSATNLVVGDTNERADIFVRDRVLETTEIVSVSSDGALGDHSVHTDTAISANGRFVAFTSSATNMVPGDTNEWEDIFRRDRFLHITERVSVGNSGEQADYLFSYDPSISADGRVVAFTTYSPLVPSDTNDSFDAYVRDTGPWRNDLLLDRGTAGLWERLNNATWLRIDTGSPLAVAAGDLDGDGKDEPIASFAGRGLFVRYYSDHWMRLVSAVPRHIVTGDFDGNGVKDLVADFGAGPWARFNNAATWVKLDNAAVQDFAVGDFNGDGRDDLVADRGSGGLWVERADSTATQFFWTQVHTASPLHIAVGDLDGDGKDELIADFSGTGLWARYNNSETWTRLSTSVSQGLAAGDFDGSGKDDLLVDYSSGLWAFYNNAVPWRKLHATSPSAVSAVDLDNSGKDEAVIGLGSQGVWVRYNNADPWRKLADLPLEAVAAGGFD